MMADRGVALVTGASRGIGKAVAVHLARAGFDVAISARTLHEGEPREHSSTVKRSDLTPLPGSLDATAALIEHEGTRALRVVMDLTDRSSLAPGVDEILAAWGRIDVLVNNGRYIGPGHMDQLLDTPVELLDLHLEANVMAPIILTKLVLPQMLERGERLHRRRHVVAPAPPIRPRPPAAAVGVSGTRCRRARSTVWSGSSPSSSATAASSPSTCIRAS